MLVDVEAEDIDLGPSKQDGDLAGDVDDTDMAAELNEDADALDSDNAEDDEPGIDREESDSGYTCGPYVLFLTDSCQRPCMWCHYMRFYRAKSKCRFSDLRPRVHDLSLWQRMWPRRL